MERNGDEEETTARRSRAVRDQRQTGVRPLQDGRVGLRLCGHAMPSGPFAGRPLVALRGPGV